MNSAATERCPRCGGGFHCGIGDAGPCACTGIALDAALLQRLRERYSGCLCLRCLQALAAGRESPEQTAADASHNGVIQEDTPCPAPTPSTA